MSERDSEIDFDFFEEPEPEEEEPRSRSPLRRSPRGPERPPTNYTPLLRLVGLVVGFIVVVVLLVFVVDRCRGNSKQSTYQNYMGDVQKVATDSQTVGTQFQLLLAQPGIKVAAVGARPERAGAATGAGGAAGAGDQPARRAAHREPGDDHGAPAARERPARHVRGVRADGEDDQPDRRRHHPRQPGEPVRRERRDLGRPLQGAVEEGAGLTRRPRRRRAGLELPQGPEPRVDRPAAAGLEDESRARRPASRRTSAAATESRAPFGFPASTATRRR